MVITVAIFCGGGLHSLTISISRSARTIGGWVDGWVWIGVIGIVNNARNYIKYNGTRIGAGSLSDVGFGAKVNITRGDRGLAGALSIANERGWCATGFGYLIIYVVGVCASVNCKAPFICGEFRTGSIVGASMRFVIIEGRNNSVGFG